MYILSSETVYQPAHAATLHYNLLKQTGSPVPIDSLVRGLNSFQFWFPGKVLFEFTDY